MELVSDLTTEAFLGALKRFMARRGHCRKIYCDNATNFVGAKNHLKELQDIVHGDRAQRKIITECNNKNIEFSFIPPRAPHFGGLWEAAVKSAKHLLQTTLASASLTYEEMETLLIEAEAILNSRPLTPLSSDPNDLTALTPGHLLIGEPLTSTVDSQARPNQVTLLKRWKLVTQLKNEFWRRWSNEYLNCLQHRHKWKQECRNVKPGTMVIIKDDNLPPLKWPLGRIVNVIKGSDGLVRVAEVRTAHNVMRRAIHRLAPLPTEDEISEQDSETASNPPPTPSSTERTEKRSATITPDEGASHHSRKRTRTTASTSLATTVLLACSLLPFSQPTAVEFQSFNRNPGIYFENLGTVSTISSEWNLINYFNVQPYWEEFQAINQYPRTLQRACEWAHQSRACSRIIAQVMRFINELDLNNQLLRSNAHPRSRRGALNFVGNIAHALFGVLDSDYAEQLSGTIDKIRQNEENLSSKIHNQTSFVDSTLNLMRRNQQNVEAEFIKVEELFNQTNQQLNNVNQQLNAERAAQLFNELAIQMILVLSNFQRVQESLLDILIDSHHGRISPALISPAQLQDELLKIKASLPSFLKLPISTHDLLKMYNLMTVKGRVTEKYVIFNIKLPLLSIEDFELFRLTPIPWKVNNAFVRIQTQFPLLVVNLHRDQYYPLTDQELSTCITVSADNHLCHHNQPLYKRGSAVSACEMNLLNQMATNSSCSIIPAGPGPYWIQLHDPNMWLFSLEKEYIINAVCDYNLTQITVRDAGILKLKENCVIKQPLVTIRGHRLLTSKSHSAYIPAVNVSDLTTQQTSNMSYQMQYKNQFMPHYEELQLIKKELSRLETDLPNDLRPHDVHHYTLGYLSLIGTIITGTIIVWKLRQKFAHTLMSLSHLNSGSRPEDNDVNSNHSSDPEIITVYGNSG